MTTTTSFWHHPIWQRPLITALAATLALSLLGCQPDAPNTHTPTTKTEATTAQVAPKKTEAELHPERTYVGKHNYITQTQSTGTFFKHKRDLKYMVQSFPQYHISKAKEWPKEDLNDQSSYDLPRFQFFWANGPMDDEYENDLKLWSMKTDGTDLRLVTDDVNDYNIDAIVRSPNNRYVAWSGDSGSKHVYDLKTGQSYEVSVNGAPRLAWSADSRYLYYYRLAQPKTMRWDSQTNQKTPVDFSVTSYSAAYNNKITVAYAYGVTTYQSDTLKELTTILVDKSIPDEKAKMLIRSVDPTGRYVWGSNQYYGWLFDMQQKTKKRFTDNFAPAGILGKGARYSASSKMGRILIVDRQKDRVWEWQALGSGRLSGSGSLYNGLANHGLWFKGNN